MKIAYGVMGYGRGHATRTAAVLPALMREHEVTVFAGGDAYEVLSSQFPTVRIPVIGYRYDARGGHSLPATVVGNLAPIGDLLWGGAGMAAVEREFRARGIEAVISDSEAWTHRVAQRLGLERISFDHVGIIAYCEPHFPPALWLAGQRDAWGYRQLMGVPERILISSFYPARPRYPQTQIVGPMLRDAVLRAKPHSGDTLLCYFNKGEHQYLPRVDRMLRLLDCPVVIYGTPYRGVVDNLHFKAPSGEGFVNDLAGCRALLSTAGNQTLGEALYLGKPVLAVPEDAFEQRLNAHLVQDMGMGLQADLRRLQAADIDRFLGQADWYRGNLEGSVHDGRAEAEAWLLNHLADLGRARTRRRARPAALRPQTAPAV